MGRGISEGAIIQHLAKIRVHHAKNGYPVPPRLIRGGAKIMANSCKPEMESILKGKGPKYALGTYATGSGYVSQRLHHIALLTIRIGSRISCMI